MKYLYGKTGEIINILFEPKDTLEEIASVLCNCNVFELVDMFNKTVRNQMDGES